MESSKLWLYEPIRLHTTPPCTTHVRAYIVVRDGEPSGTQPPTPNREEVPQPSPSDPHPEGRTHCQFQIDLGNLGDAQLRHLMEDLCQEVALGELNVPPGTHWWATGGLQQATGTLMWITRRSPSPEGGNGNQEDNHLNPLLPSMRQRCRISHKHTSHWTMTGYPMHQHLQW